MGWAKISIDHDGSEHRGFIAAHSRSLVSLMHLVGVVYILVFCSAVFLMEICLTLPYMKQYYHNTSSFKTFLSYYIYISIITNYLLILTHQKKSHFSSDHLTELPFRAGNDFQKQHDVPLDWTKCKHCNIHVPLRTRHCSVCRVCTLKKDHHCYFTACCVGFYNQKYFIIFSFYGIVGGTFALYHLIFFLNSSYAPFLSVQIYKYFLPYAFMSVLFGYTSFFELLLVMFLFLHVSSTAASTYYFLWQMFLIFRNQTSYEFLKRTRTVDMTVSEHLQSVFGPYWLISFLVPVPFLLNKGDGMHWPCKKSL
ncbi:hypothetical protein CHS0354_011579 [Potamilus streckersoni]|uniref:Palmitoyltransferase n=1 Tax=Potamilus streckersoni TaxID=2493646 RepID=A0AAE0RRK8_9BIVA|nr:hypothetical protein CHS0354_011579 [Potamilus streckersoni]